MVDGFYQQVTKALRKAGYSKAKGGKGSHEKWTHPDRPTVLVPHSTKSRHTANGILKDAGLDLRF